MNHPIGQRREDSCTMRGTGPLPTLATAATEIIRLRREPIEALIFPAKRNELPRIHDLTGTLIGWLSASPGINDCNPDSRPITVLRACAWFFVIGAVVLLIFGAGYSLGHADGNDAGKAHAARQGMPTVEFPLSALTD